MNKQSVRFVGLVLCFLAVTGMVSAATYGYVVVKGKNEAQLDREVATIERLVKGWTGGELLYNLKEKSGVIFFKKFTVTLVFAGLNKDISNFLTSGAYEGDFIKDVAVRLVYSSFKSKNEAVPGNVTVIDRKFPNIRKALELIKGKDDAKMWEFFKATSSKKYQSHLVNGSLLDPKLDVIFYSIKPVEGNRMFSVTFGEGYTREVR